MHCEKTIRCEVSKPHAGAMESMFVQVPVENAFVGVDLVISGEIWTITAVDSGCEDDLFVDKRLAEALAA